MPALSRRCFLQLSAATGLTLAGNQAAWAKLKSKTPPNILFLFSDDHAQQAISAYGSRINQTPNIDRIASEGARFNNNFCANSICGPSRATVLTGLFSHKNGFKTNRDQFDGAQDTFPKHLQQSGYQTAMIGKWHLKTDPTGFDYWEVLPGQGEYYNPLFINQNGERQVFGYNTDIVTDLALRWLQEGRDQEKPFLLMCQFKAPHRNWLPAPRHLNLYEEVEIPEPDTLFDDYSTRSSALHENEMSIERHFRTDYDLQVHEGKDWKPYTTMSPKQRAAWDAAFDARNAEFKAAKLEGKDLVRWKYQRYIKNYLRCIAAVDENVGRILDYLDWAGLSENTLVIYSSDQGFYLGEHGLYDKRWMYEESLRMPLLARWPGVIEAGSEVDALTQNIDFAPTFLEAAGAAPLPQAQGASLLPLLKGETNAPWRKSIYYHYYETGVHNVAPHEGVRTDRYKLLHFYLRDEWEFYDLQTDPTEVQNRYADPACAEVIAALKQELARLRNDYDVPENTASP